jgi:hypothetical protein
MAVSRLMTMKLLVVSTGFAAAVICMAGASVAGAEPDPCYLAGALGDRNPLCGPVLPPQPPVTCDLCYPDRSDPCSVGFC